jgi:hypothetical protein
LVAFNSSSSVFWASMILFLTFVCRNRSPCQTTLVKKPKKKRHRFFRLFSPYSRLQAHWLLLFLRNCKLLFQFGNAQTLFWLFKNLSMFRLLYRLAQVENSFYSPRRPPYSEQLFF